MCEPRPAAVAGRACAAWARLACALLLLLACGSVPAQDEAVPTEAGVKAAFLFQFGNYVEWPAGRFPAPGAPLVIAVAGDEEVARELERIVRGRSVLGRPVQVRRVGSDELDATDDAHIVYLGADAAALVPALERRPVLLVTGTQRGMPPGSMVNFVIEDARLRFDVSLDAAAAAGLRISSRLLSVARRVTGTP